LIYKKKKEIRMGKIFDFKIHSIANDINEAMDDARKKRLIADLKVYCDETGSGFSEVCKLLNIDASGFEALSEESVDFLNSLCGEGGWSVNTETGKIDVERNVYAGWKVQKMSSFPEGVDFGIIKGSLNLNGCNFSSFKGFPTKIEGGLSISGNNFSSLEGCPQDIQGSFDCSNQKGEKSLVSLEGGPKRINGDFNCSNNSLASLAGGPEYVNGNFNCSDNNIQTLQGGPEEVRGIYDCSKNELRTLIGFPKKYSGYRVDVDENDLYSLEGLPLDKTVTVDAKRNLFPKSVLSDVYSRARTYRSWAAAYLWLLTTERFQRMSKAQRDPIRDLLTTDYLKAKSITLGEIWKTDIVEDPAVKRALKKAGIDKDSEFKDDADLGADLTGIGF
jgi:hypothetical protein